jgi:DinB superfamily
MEKTENREFWLRGPVPGIPPLLQPVAHALLQSRQEVTALMEGFPEERLWDRPGRVASPGFHLQHLAGVLDRLFTYARGEALGPRQLEELAGEGRSGPVEGSSDGPEGGPGPGMNRIRDLLDRYYRQIDLALEQLAATDETTLTGIRGVGRAQIPSTVGGLLFHAAEHTQRHTGQLLVTAILLLDDNTGNPCEK